MTIQTPQRPLPRSSGDAALETLLAAPGGLAGLDPAVAATLPAMAAGLSVEALVTAASRAGRADSLTLYRLWLLAHGTEPQAAAAWFNLGVGLLDAGSAPEACVAFESAYALNPDLHQAALNLGLARERALGRAAAIESWRRVVPPAAVRKAFHVQLGRALEDEGRLGEAAEELRAALLIDPEQPDVQQHYTHLRQRTAQWPVLDPDLPGLSRRTLALNCGPLGALALHDDPARQREVAEAWIARKTRPAPQRLAPAQGWRHDRIRLGYLSTDFCRHAMSFLIAETLERHDRSAFEVYGYDASPEDGSDIRARVVAAFDHHRPIGALDDEAAARLILADEIDILIDLNGLTRGARLGVLRWKPAPVQASYLGYVGPCALPELDWTICDAITAPDAEAAAYSPPPLRLEGCYQANDSRPPALVEVTRASEGLPEDAFVFCCFSHAYKITQSHFEAWTRIAARAPRSVLWIAEDNPTARANLGAWWRAAGLAANRLIFADRVEPERYRARMTLGDLLLDTTPYNAGTVASDALRMGLPVLTVPGRAFAARMGASLLTAVGLTDCIADNIDDYVARAVGFATSPDRIAAARAHLADGAWARTIGDGAAFTRRLETALKSVRLTPQD